MQQADSAERATIGLPSVSLHIFALSSFAIAQPLYDLFGSNTEFFVAGDADAILVLLTAFILTLGIPALIVVVIAACRALSSSLGNACYSLTIAALVALILLPLLDKLAVLSGWITVAVACAIGASAAGFVNASGQARRFLSVLAPAGIVFVAIFLAFTDVSKFFRPGEARDNAVTNQGIDAPVVFILFDMLSMPAMLDGQGQIDKQLFPAFAKLAQRSHWFRNASTVAISTTQSVPAILTGIYPETRKVPTVSEHPVNLFTLLGSRADLHVLETYTDLCPATLCPRKSKPYRIRLGQLLGDMWVVYQHIVVPSGLRGRLAAINTDWGGFGEDTGGAYSGFQETTKHESHSRAWDRINLSMYEDRMKKFASFSEALKDPAASGLYYLHLKLPHPPYTLLPSGKAYIPREKRFNHMREAIASRLDPDSGLWPHNRQLLGLAYQRYLLQAILADSLLGTLVGNMEESGLFDRALVIVVADHGTTFRQGKSQRQTRDCGTYCVPLLVKLPGQAAGIESTRNVETIDLLPTIADVLEIPSPANIPGVSVFSGGAEERASKRIIDGDTIAYDLPWPNDDMDRSRRQLARLKSATMTANARTTIGPDPRLIGRRVEDVVANDGATEIAQGSSSGGKPILEIDQAEFLDQVEPASEFIPVYITGRIRASREILEGSPVAVAVNGVVQATTLTFDMDDQTGHFGVLVAETALQAGRNEVSTLLLMQE